MDVQRTKYRTVILLAVLVGYILTIGAHVIMQSQTILDAGPSVLGYSPIQMSLLFPILMMVTVIVYFIQGPFTDRIGSRMMMGVALFLTALSMLLMTLAPSFSFEMTLLAYCGVLGVASGLCFPAMLKMVTEWFPKEGHGGAFGIFISVGGLANWFFITTLLVGFFVSSGGDAGAWMWPWMIMGALNLVFIPVWFFLTGRANPAEVMEEEEKTAGHEGQAQKGNSQSPYGHPGLWLLGMIGFMFTANFIVMTMFMPVYIVAVAGFHPSNIGYFMIAMMFVGGPLSGMAGALADKKGALKVTKIALALGIIALVPAFVIVTDYWTLIVLMIFLALGGNLTYAAFYRIITDMGFSKDKMGTASGIVLGVQWLAAVIIPMLGGMLLSSNDPRTATTYLFLMAALLPMVGLALSFTMKRWIKARGLEGKDGEEVQTVPELAEVA